jgi:archaellum component FlaC
MTPLELLAILVLAGAIVVLLYYYMQDTRNSSFVRARSYITETGEKARSTVSGSVEGDEEGNGLGRVGDKMSGMSEKARTAVSGASEKVTIEGSMIDGVSEKMAGMSEKIKGTVKGVPKSTDTLSNRIDLFLNDKSDQLIKDWELATKEDVVDLEKRYSKVSRDLGELDGRFNEYRGYTNKKLKKIEERLERLEKHED